MLGLNQPGGQTGQQNLNGKNANAAMMMMMVMMKVLITILIMTRRMMIMMCFISILRANLSRHILPRNWAAAKNYTAAKRKRADNNLRKKLSTLPKGLMQPVASCFHVDELAVDVLNVPPDTLSSLYRRERERERLPPLHVEERERERASFSPARFIFPFT